LPRTGSTSGGLIALGAAAIVSGSGVLALSRRRFQRIRT
jgi:LPXTG-motif cell wall-anchored protein